MQDRIKHMNEMRYTNLMIFDHFSTRSFAAAVTDLGDGGLMIVLSVLIALYLALAGHRRGALAMLGALCFAALGIAALKLLFIGCQARFGWVTIRSPSGHAALSSAVYGTLLVLLSQRLPARWRYGPWLGLVPLILGIGYTRVYFHYHNWQEVLLGFGIGLLAVFVVWLGLLRTQAVPPFRARWATLVLVVTLIGLHGTHVRMEVLLHELAMRLRVHTPCAVAASTGKG